MRTVLQASGATVAEQNYSDKVKTMPWVRGGLTVIVAKFVALFLVIGLGADIAWAQRGQVCDSCETCTKLLESSDIKVELSGDLVHSGEGPCVVVKGDNAVFEGMERDIRSIVGKGAVGIRVEGRRALVRNVHVIGADVGMDVVKAEETTLFHVWIEALSVGVRVEAASGFRLTRSAISGGTVGVSFGADTDGTCAEQSTTQAIQSAAAVVLGSAIWGANVGIAACDAMPVLRNNRIFKNATGIRLNVPKLGASKDKRTAGPYDDCVCNPELSDVRPQSALFYSSGCHGCLVHEAWLADLRGKGHDIRLRASGPENVAASREFDVFVDRCLPQLTDVVGVPGCVPNYSCLTTDVTHKIRNGEEGMVREVEINSPEQLAAFSDECKRVAERSYRKDGDCVIHPLQDNVICSNSAIDIVAVPGWEKWAGTGNTCGKTDGYQDVGGAACDKACGEVPVEPTMPAARERKGGARPSAPTPPLATPPATVDQPTSPPEKIVANQDVSAEAAKTTVTADVPGAKSTDEALERQTASPDGNRLVYIGIGVVVLLLVVAAMVARRRKGN